MSHLLAPRLLQALHGKDGAPQLPTHGRYGTLAGATERTQKMSQGSRKEQLDGLDDFFYKPRIKIRVHDLPEPSESDVCPSTIDQRLLTNAPDSIITFSEAQK